MPQFQFASSKDLRRRLLAASVGYPAPLPNQISHLYCHLTEVCDVACHHCMYSSDSSKASRARPRLNGERLAAVVATANSGKPTKATISGGGEPFLEFASIRLLVATLACSDIEIVTAGRWARSETIARRRLQTIAQAGQENPRNPRLMLRVSADRFHREAPNPVLLDDYARIIDAWRPYMHSVSLGFRGVILPADETLAQLATILGATVRQVDHWNAVLELGGGVAVPWTFNVLRYGGKGAAFREIPTMSMMDYYAAFRTSDGHIPLARMINDAIHREYRTDEGLALTVDADGSSFIFAGSAPDRRFQFANSTRDFIEVARHFAADPISNFLFHFGIDSLVSVMARFNASSASRCTLQNDMTRLVSCLLDDEPKLAFATVQSIRALAYEELLTSHDPLIETILSNPSLVWNAAWGKADFEVKV